MYNMVNNVNKIPMNIDLYSLDFFLNFALIENFDRVLFGKNLWSSFLRYIFYLFKNLFKRIISFSDWNTFILFYEINNKLYQSTISNYNIKKIELALF